MPLDLTVSLTTISLNGDFAGLGRFLPGIEVTGYRPQINGLMEQPNQDFGSSLWCVPARHPRPPTCSGLNMPIIAWSALLQVCHLLWGFQPPLLQRMRRRRRRRQFLLLAGSGVRREGYAALMCDHSLE